MVDETKKTEQPQIGAWDKLPTEKQERVPKVDFEINIPKTVVFVDSNPREYMGDKGAYYVFSVQENEVSKVIMTSAWSLLRELKLFTPLTGKKVVITKKLDKEKQFFEVKSI